jgi:hypothetical protein
MIMMIVKKRLIYQNNIKEWLANHPNRNNPKSPLFVSLDNHSNGRKQLTRHGLYDMYRYYQKRLTSRYGIIKKTRRSSSSSK